MFACLYSPPAPRAGLARDAAAADSAATLSAVAREFSPRFEVYSPRLVVLNVSGLGRLLGDPATIGGELRRAAADRGLNVHVAIASTQVAAAILAQARAGVTIVPRGEEASRLAPFPLDALLTGGLLTTGASSSPILAAVSPATASAPASASSGSAASVPASSMAARRSANGGQGLALVALLRRWGLKTLGDLAALPAGALSERLGQQGLAWQKVARGEDARPLVTDAGEAPFEESLELEWPIEGLEPLSFVLGRLFDALSARLEERDRAAAVLHVRLRLVTRETFERSLELPSAIRDPRVLRTLVVLDLESHPVPAGIDAVTVAVDVVPGRIIQHSLLAHALPAPERVSTLLARLTALMGEGRAGSATVVDSYRPGAFTMTTFAPERSVGRAARGRSHSALSPQPSVLSREHLSVALRRFRIPVPARVTTKEDGRPDQVMVDRRGLAGGHVEVAAGPWRTSGEWWRVSEARLQSVPGTRPVVGWNRDEWDVALSDGAVYRIYLDRDRDRWFVDGMID